MKGYLLRIIVLLIAFALGVSITLVGGFNQRGRVQQIRIPDQKPFVLVVRKRMTTSELSNSCH